MDKSDIFVLYIVIHILIGWLGWAWANYNYWFWYKIEVRDYPYLSLASLFISVICGPCVIISELISFKMTEISPKFGFKFF